MNILLQHSWDPLLCFRGINMQEYRGFSLNSSLKIHLNDPVLLCREI
jgi:hypothetical protein